MNQTAAMTRPLAKARSRGRWASSWSPRSLSTSSQAAAAPARRRARRAATGPVPVLAATARRADVPVYLDGVGTTRALNTVTVRPQVDGKLIKVALQRRPGRRARRRARAHRSDHLPGAARSGDRQEGAGRGARSPMRGIDLERYTRLAATNSIDAPAGRHAEGAGRAARSAGASSIRPRSTTRRPFSTTPHHRPDRRPHRHPPGRRGQHRPCLGRHRHRRHHADSADLGAVQPAATAARASSTRHSPKGRSTVEVLGAGQQDRDRSRHAAGGRQPGRPATGTVRLKAEFPNRRAAALARAVRQCPAADRDPAPGRGGPDRGGAARAERSPSSTWSRPITPSRSGR